MRRFLSLTILLAASTFSFAVTKNKPFPEYTFNKGLDTYHAPTALPEGYVQNSLNVLFDDVAPATKRAGYVFSWGVNITSQVVITQGINDQFSLFHAGILNIITVPPGTYFPSSLASTITSAMSVQSSFGATYSLAMVFSGGNFVYQSNTSSTPQLRFGFTSPVSRSINLGNTLGWPTGSFIPGGAGPVYVSTAPNAPAYTNVGPSLKGLWTYTDQTNTTWEIAWSSSQLTANNLAGTQVVIATVSANNTIGETNAFGNAYFVDQTNGLYYWNGSTTVYVSGSPKGSIITQFHNRLWVTGLAVPNGNQLYGSAYYSGTTWTTGLNPTDPVQFSIGLQDNFDNLTAEYVYLDTLYLFKHSSIFALYGFDQTSFQISQLTQECGCVDGNTIQTFNGAMEFVSLRGVEAFNGYSCNRISDAIKNKIDPAISVRSYTQQSWVQSQQADWQAGTLTNVSATASPPNLVISTSSFFDSTSTFNSGTFSNTQLTATGIEISTNAVNVSNNSFESEDGTNHPLNWTQVSGSWPGENSQQTVHCGTVTPKDGSWWVGVADGPGGGLNFTASFIDAVSSAVISTITPGGGSSACPWILADIPMTGSDHRLGRIQLQWGGLGTLESDPFISNGNDIQFYWGADSVNGGNNWELFFDFFTNSPKSTITTGTFTSETFDTTFTGAYLSTSTVATINTEPVLIDVQTSPDNTTWSDLPFGGLANRYERYISTFTLGSTDTALSQLNSFSWSATASTGTFKSQIWNVGTLAGWGNFTVQDVPNGGSLAFSICSSSSILMTSPSCSAQSVNSQILASTNTYVQWYATFTITAATQAPTLQSGTVQWYTGGNQPPMASTVWDNRYWLSLTTNSVDTANDAVMVLNKSGAWAQFDIHAGAFTQYKNSLYHADSLPTGNIYLDNQGWSDNGNPINVFINTRNEALGDLTSDDYMYALYPTAMATGNCTMTVAYSVDNSTTSYPLGSPLLSEFNSITSVRLPFPIDAAHQDFGQSVDFTLGTNDAQCGWQFLGIEGLYKTRPVQ